MPRSHVGSSLFLLAVGILSGTLVPSRSEASVATLDPWSAVHSSAPANTSGSVSTSAFTPAAGSQRVLIVAAVLETAGNATLTTFDASVGDKAMTLVASTAGRNGREHAGLWFLLEGRVPAGSTTATVSYTTSASVVTGIHVKWATFSGVDQTSPTVSVAQNAAAATSVPFGGTVAHVTGGLTLYVAGNGGSPATMTPPPDFSEIGDATTTTSGHTSFAANTASHGSDGSYAGTTSVSFGGGASARSAIAVVALRPAASCSPPAVTTQPAGATICPGASTTLTVVAAGTGPLSYQWYRGTAPTATAPVGTNSSSLSTSALAATTNYWVRISDACGSVDSDTATVSVDTSRPAAPTGAACTDSAAGRIDLSWTNPVAEFAGALLVRGPAGGAASTFVPVDGTGYAAGAQGADFVVVDGDVSSVSDAGLASGTTYAYRVWAYDTCRNYSGPTDTTCSTASSPGVTAGAPTASADSSTQVTVRAPFSGDSNANSSTAVERGASPAGPWTTVCSGLGGASPRTCTDGSLTAATTFWYRVTFSDPDGVSGTNPRLTAAVTTLAGTVYETTIGAVSVSVASCTSALATATFAGDDNLNGTTTFQYGAGAAPGSWTTACTVSGASPRPCAFAGLTASTLYSFRASFTDPDGVVGTNPTAGLQATTSACGADAVAPTITLLAPSRNAVLSGADLVKVQVWDAGGLRPIEPVQGQVDSTAPAGFTLAFWASTSLTCGPGCTVFQYTLTEQPGGPHYVAVRATDAAGNAAVVTIPFRAVAAGTGAGNLLRRTSGSQLCLDCHNLQTHNSQATSTDYGNWANDCATCHTPHATRNVFLVRERIETPNSGLRAVDFRAANGVAEHGHATPQAAGAGVNVCEVCHTRTRNADATPRARNDSPTDWTKHYSSSCTGCHRHAKGFAAGESEGGFACRGCHADIWDGMQAAAAKTSRHTLAVDTFSDDGVAWGSPLSANAAAVRSCLNTCHHDHPHTAGLVTTHEYNVYKDATSNASRAAASRDTATKAKTDFEDAEANGGLCISCHRNSVEPAAAPDLPAHPAVPKAPYAASAHNFTSNALGTWRYTLHDGGVFERNCTKCHAGRTERSPAVSAIPFRGVHWSDDPSLLAGSTNPGATPADFVCYNCHGNGTIGTDLSGSDIATQVARTRNHPASSDATHESISEYNGSTFGAGLGPGVERHASCLDCHEPHATKAGRHVVGSSTAGPPLEGAWGVRLSSNPAFWEAPGAGSFTKTVMAAGTDLEATLCFKCHSSYYGPLPTSPSGGFTETDTAREFNPDNVGNYATTGTTNWQSGETAGGFHPVLATAGSNLGAVSLSNLVTTSFAWSTSSRNRMACSDCHGSSSAADPMGPHGSTASFLLRGPNTTWSASVVAGESGMPAGTFCANCHSPSFSSSRFPTHFSRDAHRVPCWNCHAAVPHGGPRPGILVSPAGASAGVGGTIAGWDTTVPYWGLSASSGKLYIKSYPVGSTTNWGRPNCGCNGIGH